MPVLNIGSETGILFLDRLLRLLGVALAAAGDAVDGWQGFLFVPLLCAIDSSPIVPRLQAHRRSKKKRCKHSGPAVFECSQSSGLDPAPVIDSMLHPFDSRQHLGNRAYEEPGPRTWLTPVLRYVVWPDLVHAGLCFISEAPLLVCHYVCLGRTILRWSLAQPHRAVNLTIVLRPNVWLYTAAPQAPASPSYVYI